MILEVAVLSVIPNKAPEFLEAFDKAAPILVSARGYIDHDLQRCLETPSQFVLLVTWETLQDHTIGFRKSAEYKRWSRLLHHFYDPFPTVEHYVPVERYEEVSE